jgi:hypothetical protein
MCQNPKSIGPQFTKRGAAFEGDRFDSMPAVVVSKACGRSSDHCRGSHPRQVLSCMTDRTQNDPQRWDEATRWLVYVDQDLLAAEVLLAAHERRRIEPLAPTAP